MWKESTKEQKVQQIFKKKKKKILLDNTKCDLANTSSSF